MGTNENNKEFNEFMKENPGFGSGFNVKGVVLSKKGEEKLNEFRKELYDEQKEYTRIVDIAGEAEKEALKRDIEDGSIYEPGYDNGRDVGDSGEYLSQSVQHDIQMKIEVLTSGGYEDEDLYKENSEYKYYIDEKTGKWEYKDLSYEDREKVDKKLIKEKSGQEVGNAEGLSVEEKRDFKEYETSRNGNKYNFPKPHSEMEESDFAKVRDELKKDERLLKEQYEEEKEKFDSEFGKDVEYIDNVIKPSTDERDKHIDAAYKGNGGEELEKTGEKLSNLRGMIDVLPHSENSKDNKTYEEDHERQEVGKVEELAVKKDLDDTPKEISIKEKFLHFVGRKKNDAIVLNRETPIPEEKKGFSRSVENIQKEIKQEKLQSEKKLKAAQKEADKKREDLEKSLSAMGANKNKEKAAKQKEMGGRELGQ